jgi:RHS repeat-associated protein
MQSYAYPSFHLFPLTLGYFSYGGNQGDGGVRIEDLNGDGLPDIIQAIQSMDAKGNYIPVKKTYLNKGSRPYFLKTIHTSGGATIDLEMKNSAQLRTANNTQANPKLPLNLPVLTKMTLDDGFGNKTFTNYTYEDGHHYFKDSNNREFAGFRVVTKTDTLGYKTKTYFHQSENSVADTANGEWDDHISKKGIPYRTEAYDNQNRLVSLGINKIEKTDLGNGRFLVTQKQTVSQNTDPATSAKRATAKAFEYDPFGNPTTVTDYGEVTLNGNDGSFSDIGNDLVTQTMTYALNETDHLIGFVSESKMKDQDGKQVSDQRLYYDTLTLGEVAQGNPTKTEMWLNTTNGFLAGTTEYDDFGLPIKQTNARGFSTTMAYDPLRLYPTSVTNALGQTSQTILDLGIGQPIESTDPNGLKTKQTFDGIGRPVKMEISDPKNTGGLVVTKTFEFNDYSMPRATKQIAHNDDGQTVESFSYTDGLGRTIETKQEAPNGKWVTAETIFDERGNVKKSVQPFFANSSDFENLDAGKTGTTFVYDAMGRSTAVINPLGTTATVYDGWNQTVTDPNGKIRNFQFDSRGRLIQATEHLGTQSNRTNYSYDTLGNLTGLTDALGNTRAFTYDSLGHRLTQTDATKPGRSGHVWTYKYDENGNLTERLDANGKAVRTAYDALDRATQMDLESQPGTDFTFEYDQGANAIGRLSAVIGQNYEKRPTYDLLGRVILERKKIAGKDFVFTNDYDLLGGVKKLTYPDGMTVDTAFDSAHQISKVSSDGKTFADQFDYSPLGQMAQVNLGNGVVTTNVYDPQQLYRLTQKKSLLYGSARIQDFLYNYDAVGNLLKLDDQSNGVTSKTVNYRYDDLYRLLEARTTNTGNQQMTVSNFQYDPIGNMTFKSNLGLYEYKAENPHAVTKAGTKVFGYDSAGNMTQRDGKTYQYDEFGKITKIADETAYQYDEAGQRILKTDLKTGESMIYVNDLFESKLNEDTKYVFAGKLKIAKVTRKTVPAPTVDPVTQPISDPTVNFSGTKPADLSLWLNGIEILASGPETTWTHSADLIPGDNTFDFYTKKDADTVSRKVTLNLHYEVPAATVEPVDSPQTVTHVTLKGTKGANTGIWINGAEGVPLNADTTWEFSVSLTSTQNAFEIVAKDRIGNPSTTTQINISYITTPPTVETFDQPVKANPFSIKGTKAGGMGIWINGEETVKASDDPAWTTRLKLAKGINQFSVTAKNEFGLESNAVLLTIPYDTNAPSLDPVSSPTSLTIVPLTGSKRAYTGVWIDGKEAVKMDAEEVWMATVRLTDLHNTFTILAKDEEGLESETISLTLDYDPVAPVADPVAASTSTNPFMLSGTKVAGTAIWINGKEVVPADDTTIWIVNIPLAEGENNLEIKAVSRFGIESEPVKASLSYIRPAYTPGNPGPTSGGGGGYSQDPTLLKRMIEQKAQKDELALLEKEAKNKGVVDSSTPASDLVFRNQNGDRTNTPKPLWPTAESKTNVQFKNVQIAYGNDKTTLSWDGMSKEVATFDIYRSTDPIPSPSAQNTAHKIATIRLNGKTNKHQDKTENGERFTYRIVALNKAGKILRTSLLLTPDTLFATAESGSTIDFRNHTDKPFSKVYVSDHPRFTFEATDDSHTLLITPKNGFKSGARINVRFIDCQPKKKGGEICTTVEEKWMDVFVVKDDGFVSNLRKMGNQLLGLLVPQAQAKGVDPEEKVEYLLTDHLGGVDVVMDEQGNVVERRDYLPFGEERVSEVTGANKERHGFTGKELDSESGLYYYGARYYDPALGRFASLDPLILGESAKSLQSVLGNPQGLNGYSYVENNPVKYIDETGNYKEDVHYDLTLFLMSNTGLTKGQSEIVAYRDQYMDDNPETMPFSISHPLASYQNLKNGTTEKYHFASRNEAIRRLKQAIEEKSSPAFGDALHTYQDTYSHAGLTPTTHANVGSYPDFTYNDSPKAYDMAKQTFFFGRKLELTTKGTGELTSYQFRKEGIKIWNDIKGEVKNYLGMENKTNSNIAKRAKEAKEK